MALFPIKGVVVPVDFSDISFTAIRVSSFIQNWSGRGQHSANRRRKTGGGKQSLRHRRAGPHPPPRACQVNFH